MQSSVFSCVVAVENQVNSLLYKLYTVIIYAYPTWEKGLCNSAVKDNHYNSATSSLTYESKVKETSHLKTGKTKSGLMNLMLYEFKEML